MTFSGRFALSLIQFAVHQGCSPEELLALTGQSVEELGREDGKVTSTTFNRLVEKGVAATADVWFGLHAGEYLNLSALGLIGQITQSSSTVKEALDYCCEFAALFSSPIQMKLEKERRTYKLSIIPDHRWLNQSGSSVKQIIDLTLTFSLREFHALTLEKQAPLAVHFPFQQPEAIDEYRRVLNAPLLFAQPTTALIFSEEHIEAPVITSNYSLLRLLVAHGRERLAEIEGESGFHTTVKRSIINLETSEYPTIETVAQNLNLSLRTLQRRLAEEGYTYSQVFEEVRRESVLRYLRRTDINVNEIAYLLHYSDGSTFIRWFRKWMGMTPGEYRREALG